MRRMKCLKRSACAFLALALALGGLQYALAGEVYAQSQFGSAYDQYGGDLQAVVSSLDDAALDYLEALITAERASRASVPAKGRTSTDSSGMTVWLSATGSKYHSQNDCGSMNPKKATVVALEYAKGLGMEPCKNCQPPQ